MTTIIHIHSNSMFISLQHKQIHLLLVQYTVFHHVTAKLQEHVIWRKKT